MNSYKIIYKNVFDDIEYNEYLLYLEYNNIDKDKYTFIEFKNDMCKDNIERFESYIKNSVNNMIPCQVVNYTTIDKPTLDTNISLWDAIVKYSELIKLHHIVFKNNTIYIVGTIQNENDVTYIQVYQVFPTSTSDKFVIF